MADAPPALTGSAATHTEVLWLLGQPQLADYLHFVKENAIGGSGMCPRQVADEWRAANEVYYQLEESESGIADEIECLPLDPGLSDLVDRLKADPFYRATFDTLPMTVEMVELDKLIVSQTHVTSSFCEHRSLRLSPYPTAEELFRYCQPLERELPPCLIEKTDGDKFVFSSESTDLRPQEPMLLRGEVLAGVVSTGPLSALIGLGVGFGSNFLTAIRSDARLVLHNGYHRAYSLRSMGITHAPCLVETVTRRDELQVAATEKVSSDPLFYFRAGRPPLLKDFFDPRLTRRFPVRRRRTVVEVEFTVRKSCYVEPDQPRHTVQ